jgi:hypothetical protein
MEQGGNQRKDLINRCQPKQREVAHNKIDQDRELARGNLLVRKPVKLSAPGELGRINKILYSIRTDSMDRACGKLTDEPSVTAAKIKDGARLTAENRIDDSLIRNLLATLDAPLTYRGSPRMSVDAP